ncbi:MAG: hypothetical protein GY929_21320 [Actinomycetia bacterium]|nr:hypothetical protein [Actinomycetes bacterium]
MLRFLFDAANRPTIDVTTVTVNETALATGIAPHLPPPQTLQIGFQPLTMIGAPEVQLPFAGRLTFLADPTAPGTQPTADEIILIETEATDWRRRGTLLLDASAEAEQELAAALGDPPVTPNRMWIGPVELTPDFLLATLPTIASGVVRTDLGSLLIPGDPGWDAHAISAFLAGRFNPWIDNTLNGGGPADPPPTTLAVLPMPEVADPGDGSGLSLELNVARHQRTPQDGPAEALLGLDPDLALTDPRHPANGAIPAAWFLRQTQSATADALPGDPWVEAIVPSTPTLNHVLVHFTRTMDRTPNFSHVLAQLHVRIQSANSTVYPLAAHGVLFIPVNGPNASNDFGGELMLSDWSGTPSTVADSPISWLDGSTPDSWRVKGRQIPILFGPGGLVDRHILVRRRMRDQMMLEPAVKNPAIMACTFMSLRRTIRAIIDNRACGGRLIGEQLTDGRTLAETARMLADVITPDAMGNSDLPDADPTVLHDGGPDPAGSHLDGSFFMRRYLHALFPDPPPNHPGCDRIFGEVLYDLWQTQIADITTLGSHRPDYEDQYLARGAAGAIVAMGLAGWVLNEPRNGRTDREWIEAMAHGLDGVLTPGDLLQKWSHLNDFEGVANRTASTVSKPGHSPVFARYRDVANGHFTMVLYDQHGENTYWTKTRQDGTFAIVISDYWAAATWTE